KAQLPGITQNDVEGAGIGRQIAPEQAVRFHRSAPEPFETGLLYPERRARRLPGQMVEQPARGLDNADAVEPRRKIAHEDLFAWYAEPQPQDIRSQSIDFLYLPFQRVAGEIAVAMAGDGQGWVKLPHRGDGPAVLSFACAQKVEADAFPLRQSCHV